MRRVKSRARFIRRPAGQRDGRGGDGAAASRPPISRQTAVGADASYE